MRTAAILFTGLLAASFALTPQPRVAVAADPPAPPAGFPRFKVEEIDTALSIGYAVLTTDINADGKPDIVVVDQRQVVWYENPGWKKRVILNGKTLHDNVCAAAVDIDGDGKPEIVLGAGWKPFDTQNAGTLQWLKRGKSLDDEWTMYPIPCDEPTVHRVRVFDIDGDGKPEIVHVPLMGREATAKGNWLDGRPVRVMAYKIPAKDPEKPASWKPFVLSDELHVCHNFWPISPEDGRAGQDVLVVAYEGVFRLSWFREKGTTRKVGEGNQANPKGTRGASEIKMGSVWAPKGTPAQVIATVEPWHGNQIVTYTHPTAAGKLWDRHVIDEQLRWGHGVWFADLDGDGPEELVIGVRDDPNPKLGDKHTERRGVRLYKCTDGKGAKWDRYILEDGGVAVEDLTVADLNGDGKPDIVACGRATKNVRIYWNQGK